MAEAYKSDLHRDLRDINYAAAYIHAATRESPDTLHLALKDVIAANRGWRDSDVERPLQDEIVIVHGGIAQYRNGVFYTGMETPQFRRPIQWAVTHWMSFPVPPSSAAQQMSDESRGYPEGAK